MHVLGATKQPIKIRNEDRRKVIVRNLFMGRGQTECDSYRASDHVHRHAQGWHKAVAACLVSFLAAPTATSITVHDAANADERHHATVLAGQVGAGNHAMDSLIALRSAMAACCVSCAGQACAIRTTLLTGQDTASRLAAATRSVKGVAFSPDGRLPAGAYSDGAIRLWNPATGRLARSPLQMDVGGQEDENGVAFSPDGSLLASAYGNGTLRLWNLDTGQHGGLASGGWLVTTASVIAIVLAAFASVITMREIRLAGRRLPSAGRQLWRSCC